MPSAPGDGDKEIIIAVMGVTGTGKSHFIREVSGISDVEVSGKLRSCTAEVRPHSFPYAGVKITLVDTPGFNDSARSDAEILSDICLWMSSNYRKGKLFSGIIYLHRITDVRMDGSSMKYVRMFQRMCGPGALKNVLLTTTQWCNVNQVQGDSRERELREGDFWGGLITEGASVERFMGTRESGLGLIDKLIGNTPEPLGIQGQMVDQGMAMAQTEAGKFMNEEWISLQRKYEEDLKRLESLLQKAKRQRDEILESLEIERVEFQKKLEDAVAAKKFLANLEVDVMRKLEEAINEKEEERQRKDRAVIAVDAKDISIGSHAWTLFTSYPTRGRLIYDIRNPKEFEKRPFDIKIRYQPNVFAPIAVLVKTVEEFFDNGMSKSNYIVHNQGYYECNAGGPIWRGSRKFIIFTKY